MSDPTRLERATELMRGAYGSVELPEGDSTWMLFLRVLFGVGSDHRSSDALTEILKSPPIASPHTTMQTTTGSLVEVLAPVPRGPQKASLIRSVAAWWIEQFGEELTPEWTRGAKFYRESLRAIRGLGPATVDELLLFAARLKVFPVDRPTLRIAVRHGWLSLPIEDEDAQSFFVRGLAQTESENGTPGIDPREFSRLLAQVGASHCGREPNCDGCPLQSMLPFGGPLSPESC
jgi:endonuclease III related protein